jgi:hypothetical protein
MLAGVAFLIGLGIGALLASRRRVRLQFAVVVFSASVALSPFFSAKHAVIAIGDSGTHVKPIDLPGLKTIGRALQMIGELPLHVAGGFFFADVFFPQEGVATVRPWPITTSWLAFAAGMLIAAATYWRRRENLLPQS